MRAIEVLTAIVDSNPLARIFLNEYCKQEDVCGIVAVSSRYDLFMKPVVFMADEFTANNQKKICTRQSFQFVRVDEGMLKYIKSHTDTVIDGLANMFATRVDMAARAEELRQAARDMDAVTGVSSATHVETVNAVASAQSRDITITVGDKTITIKDLL